MPPRVIFASIRNPLDEALRTRFVCGQRDCLKSSFQDQGRFNSILSRYWDGGCSQDGKRPFTRSSARRSPLERGRIPTSRMLDSFRSVTDAVKQTIWRLFAVLKTLPALFTWPSWSCCLSRSRRYLGQWTYCRGTFAKPSEVIGSTDSERLWCRFEKYQFAQPQVDYLGHILSQEGIAKGPKVDAVRNMPPPTDVPAFR